MKASVGRDGSNKELGQLLYELFEREGRLPDALVTSENIDNHVAEGLAKKAEEA